MKLFYNRVTSWPKNQSEMDLIAEQILRNLKVLFACVFFEANEKTAETGTGTGLNVFGLTDSSLVNRSGFAAFLKDQWKVNVSKESLSANSTVIYPLEIQSGSYRWPFSNSIQYLYYACPTTKLIGSAENFLFIVVGRETKMAKEEEIAFLSMLEHLIGLAQIADLNADIKMKNQFLSIASHELKTPLTSIYGILQLQERMLRLKGEQPSFPDQERHHNFLKMVIKQVERLNEMIDGLLDVSRIQNGRFMVEPTETDVVALLKDCVQARLTVIAQEAGVHLNIDSIPKLVARVDPVRMEEVILNLVMNAIRFSPEGGVVWIRLRSEDGAFRMTVRDQGPSIPPEDRERIFQPFERAQRTGRMGGLGLGLFISRQIAVLHGGNVSLVESIPGKGNLFEAYFPMAQ